MKGKLAFGFLLITLLVVPSLLGCQGSTYLAPHVTQNASAIVLLISDFGPGWMTANSGIETKSGATSAYMSSFANVQNIYSPSQLICQVAVYPNINSAHQVYLGEVPQNVSLAHPNYGDECFYNNSILLDQKLVFRKMNVVVWIEIQNDMFNTPYSAASSVQAKIK